MKDEMWIKNKICDINITIEILDTINTFAIDNIEQIKTILKDRRELLNEILGC